MDSRFFKTVFARLLAVTAVFVFAGGAAAAQVGDRDRGIELYREGRYADAARLLEEAAQADPRDRESWLYLGAAHVHSGDDKLARKAFRKTDSRQREDVLGYDSLLKITSKPRPAYPRGVHSSQGSAKVTLVVEFLSSGKVGFIRSLVSGGPQEFERESITAAHQVRFTPAVKGGKPVTVIQFIEYSFWIQ